MIIGSDKIVMELRVLRSNAVSGFLGFEVVCILLECKVHHGHAHQQSFLDFTWSMWHIVRYGLRWLSRALLAVRVGLDVSHTSNQSLGKLSIITCYEKSNMKEKYTSSWDALMDRRYPKGTRFLLLSVVHYIHITFPGILSLGGWLVHWILSPCTCWTVLLRWHKIQLFTISPFPSRETLRGYQADAERTRNVEYFVFRCPCCFLVC